GVPLLRIIIMASALVLMIVLWLLVNKTRTGKAMRATSYDREAAAMMGIDIDRVIVFAFVLGSALAGAAGVLFAARAPASVTIGFVAGLKGFTAAVIGGIGSIPGAAAGGLMLGFAESSTQGYVSTRWSDLAVLGGLLERLRAPHRLRHDPLHAARARVERRRRLGRSARPGLHRVLRSRCVLVRAARLEPVPRAPSDGRDRADRARDRRRGRARDRPPIVAT